MDRYEVGGTYSATLSGFEHDPQIRQLAKQPGCYCIRSPDRALYIGSSQASMTDRIQAHVNGKGTVWLFNRLQRGKRCQERLTVTLYPLEPGQVRQKEAELIQEHNGPLYNSRRPSVTVL